MTNWNNFESASPTKDMQNMLASEAGRTGPQHNEYFVPLPVKPGATKVFTLQEAEDGMKSIFAREMHEGISPRGLGIRLLNRRKVGKRK